MSCHKLIYLNWFIAYFKSMHALTEASAVTVAWAAGSEEPAHFRLCGLSVRRRGREKVDGRQ